MLNMYQVLSRERRYFVISVVGVYTSLKIAHPQDKTSAFYLNFLDDFSYKIEQLDKMERLTKHGFIVMITWLQHELL